jgi:hypothetical protein
MFELPVNIGEEGVLRCRFSTNKHVLPFIGNRKFIIKPGNVSVGNRCGKAVYCASLY